MKNKPLIGLIGMGWVGGSYARDFCERGFETVSYSMEFEYVNNKNKIKDCDIVLIAVPTPTKPDGFDVSILRSVMPLVGKGKTAVIKSTVTPGMTKKIQEENPDIYVIHSPQFLTESSALHDASHPRRNIIGIPKDTQEYRERAETLLSILPRAQYSTICSSEEAEIIKYARNMIGYIRTVFYNILFDVATNIGADWNKIREAIANDPDNGPEYTMPVHKNGRGAGGHCFIKDFKAFTDFYSENSNDVLGIDVLRMIEKKNINLLLKSKKDLDLIKGVYGI